MFPSFPFPSSPMDFPSMRRKTCWLPGFFPLNFIGRCSLNDGGARQTSRWARPKELVSSGRSRKESVRRRSGGAAEAVSGGFLRSQLLSHRRRQQKRPHQLQVKVQSPSLALILNINGNERWQKDDAGHVKCEQAADWEVFIGCVHLHSGKLSGKRPRATLDTFNFTPLHTQGCSWMYSVHKLLLGMHLSHVSDQMYERLT